jgi:hypothetical protein
MAARSEISRRRFLCRTSAAAGGLLAAGSVRSQTKETDGEKLPRVALVGSIWRFRSHAYHIGGRFVHGYTWNGFHHQPPFKLVRMYLDQFPKDDLGREFCRRHGIELCKTPAEALGGRLLDVDAVLLVVEHGDYPLNEYRQILYPRYELFSQVVDVFRSSGRSVPVFVDKHLSYDRRKAAKMLDTARELNFGMMAGSSLPVTWRQPELEPPPGTPFREGLVVFGFDELTPEIYLFHALESLQCLFERRAGGETGVKSITCLGGDEVWRAGDAGRWNRKLLAAALARCPTANVGDMRENVREPMAAIIEYRDGTRASVLNLPEQTSDIAFAGTIAGRDEPVATCFQLPRAPGARFFNPLVHHIEQFFATGRPPYPIQRTLLTSALCDLAMHSLHDGGKSLPMDLDVRYQPPANSGFIRGPIPDAG